METIDSEMEDPALAAARCLLHLLDEDPPDVLVFGESTLSFVGADEADERSLADVLVEALAPRSTLVVAGPGYGVDLHREFVRIAATREPRPLVVTTLYARGTLPAFLHHPIWGHRRQIERLRRVTGDVPAEVRAPYVPPTVEEFAAYETMPYPTFVAGERTIADFMRELRSPSEPFSAEHIRWLYEFHLGGIPDPRAVEAFTAYGRVLRSAGFPVVAVQNPISMAEAARYLGSEFLAWHRRNTDAVRDAFVAGYGPGAVILETADGWTADDFLEPAVEHLAAPARCRLASVIVDAVESLEAPAGLRIPEATAV